MFRSGRVGFRLPASSRVQNRPAGHAQRPRGRPVPRTWCLGPVWAVSGPQRGSSCVVRGRGPPGRRRRNRANAHQETFSTAGSHPRVDALVGERATCAAPSSSPMDTEHMPRPVFSTAIARSSVGLRVPVTQPWAVQSALPLPHASAPPAQSDQRTTRPGWRASAVADRAGRAPSQSAAR